MQLDFMVILLVYVYFFIIYFLFIKMVYWILILETFITQRKIKNSLKCSQAF